MECTSPFGIGVNQPDIDIVIHIGVPSTILIYIVRWYDKIMVFRCGHQVIQYTVNTVHDTTRAIVATVR